MKNYLFKSTLRVEYEERTSTASTFGLVIEGNRIKLIHVGGTVPHISDLVRALHVCPEILDLYKRVYSFSIESDFSGRGRGYYTLRYYPYGVTYLNSDAANYSRSAVGFSKKAETMEINSSGKVEDWVGKEFYIADFVDFIMEATPNYGMQQDNFLSFKKIDMEPRDVIEPDLEFIKQRIEYFLDSSAKNSEITEAVFEEVEIEEEEVE
jgi:hypothetical protein